MMYSVVIISYNGKDVLRRCLDTLKRVVQSMPQIIVVDDGSTDGTDRMIEVEYSFVELIKNGKNIGPVAARNRGAEKAKGECIIFIDNDVLVEAGTFQQLIACLEKYPKVEVVGAKIIPEGQEKMAWNIGYDPNNFRETIGYMFGYISELFPSNKVLKKLASIFVLNYWNYNKERKVDWVVEGCFAVRRKAFEKINGFDENFFMFFEGPDLCKRIRNNGGDIYFYPQARVTLLDSHTHTSTERAEYWKASKLYFYKKHYFPVKSNTLLYCVGEKVSGVAYLLVQRAAKEIGK